VLVVQVLQGTTLADSVAVKFGGAIYLDSGVLTLTACRLARNRALYDGGGINLHDGVASISDSVLVQNAALLGAGVMVETTLAAVGTSFVGNTATDSGGGVYADRDSVVTLANCTLAGNAALDGAGAYATDAQSFLAVNSTFTRNGAGDSGGGLATLRQSNVALRACVFAGNTAVNNGGGVSVLGQCTVAVAGCHFRGNAAAFGAALDVVGVAVVDTAPTAVVANGCDFVGNAAGTSGAGFRLSGPATLNVSFGMFTNNVAALTGGGGAVEAGILAAGLADCVFQNNTASFPGFGTGGGLYIVAADARTALARLAFVANRADGGGGAAWWLSTHQPGLLPCVGCTYAGNTRFDFATQPVTVVLARAPVALVQSGVAFAIGNPLPTVHSVDRYGGVAVMDSATSCTASIYGNLTAGQKGASLAGVLANAAGGVIALTDLALTGNLDQTYRIQVRLLRLSLLLLLLLRLLSLLMLLPPIPLLSCVIFRCTHCASSLLRV
jgi:predicted outer membrane repeat protein